MSQTSSDPSKQASAGNQMTGTVGIIAGNGHLPYEIAASVRAAGRGVFIIGIAGEVDAEVEQHPHAIIEWGHIGQLFKLLTRNNVDDVIFAGGILRRPELRLSKLDFGAFLPYRAVLLPFWTAITPSSAVWLASLSVKVSPCGELASLRRTCW